MDSYNGTASKWCIKETTNKEEYRTSSSVVLLFGLIFLVLGTWVPNKKSLLYNVGTSYTLIQENYNGALINRA